MDKKLAELQREAKDMMLVCVDCGVEFSFTSGEQLYFASKGLSEPKRCENCRRKRKESLIKITR
jgi:hypothetical protein